MTTYTTVSGVKQLLDLDLWDEDILDEQIVTLSPAVKGWVNLQINKLTEFTEAELLTEPIIVLASNCYTVYLLGSAKLDGHSVEEISLAMRRLDDAIDYLRAYCLRIGITPLFDMPVTPVSGCVDFAFACGSDSGCI
jgi:hypothetical protein